ncbi:MULTISPECIES: nuclear transport factor 2 family protein [unclassified Luteimonas]
MPSHGSGDTAVWRAGALLVLLCMIAIGCTRPPPEQALRDAFKGLQAAIEARDAGDVASFLAEDFIGPGGLDRDGARRLAALHFLRHADVGVLPGPLDVELQENHARVRFGAVLSGGGSGRLLPESARAWQVDTGWRLVDGDWRMASADWSPALR